MADGLRSTAPQPCPDCSEECSRAPTCEVRRAALPPGSLGVLIGKRFGWNVRCHLQGGYVEATCLGCGRTYEVKGDSIARGESRGCARCAAARRTG
jgi:hypothetical protein